MNNMSPKTGRPYTEDPKEVRFSVMLDADAAKQVDDYCKAKEISKGELIRRAVITFFAVEGLNKAKKDHTSEESRLRKLRKKASEIGYSIRKGVMQPDSAYAHERIAGYAIIDRQTNLVVMGYGINSTYQMDIDDVEEYFNKE
jgi:hypothetical protein